MVESEPIFWRDKKEQNDNKKEWINVRNRPVSYLHSMQQR